MVRLHKNTLRNYLSNNVVKIKNSRGMGTGFYAKSASGKTYIVTNNHICSDEKYVEIQGINDNFYKVREVIKKSKSHDLCIVDAANDRNSFALKIGSTPDNGDELYILGHPSGNQQTLSMGEVVSDSLVKINFGNNLQDEQCPGVNIKIDQSDPMIGLLTDATSICIVSFKSLLISAIIYPGNSGSPVVNRYGTLIGIVFAGTPDKLSQGFIVPIKELEQLLQDL